MNLLAFYGRLYTFQSLIGLLMLTLPIFFSIKPYLWKSRAKLILRFVALIDIVIHIQTCEYMSKYIYAYKYGKLQ